MADRRIGGEVLINNCTDIRVRGKERGRLRPGPFPPFPPFPRRIVLNTLSRLASGSFALAEFDLTWRSLASEVERRREAPECEAQVDEATVERYFCAAVA